MHINGRYRKGRLELTMKNLTNLLAVSLIIVLFAMSSCATTSTTSVWKDPAYQGKINKVFVIGVASKDTNRRVFEDEFVRQLKMHSTGAVASYSVFQKDAIIDKDSIAAKARELGADTVLVARPVGRKTEQAYVPGQAYAVPGPYHRWGSYYGYAATPGYVVDDEYVIVETNLYDLKTENLIWSSQSETIVLASDQELIKSFIQVMVNKMSNDGLIK